MIFFILVGGSSRTTGDLIKPKKSSKTRPKTGPGGGTQIRKESPTLRLHGPNGPQDQSIIGTPRVVNKKRGHGFRWVP